MFAESPTEGLWHSDGTATNGYGHERAWDNGHSNWPVCNS